MLMATNLDKGHRVTVDAREAEEEAQSCVKRVRIDRNPDHDGATSNQRLTLTSRQALENLQCQVENCQLPQR